MTVLNYKFPEFKSENITIAEFRDLAASIDVDPIGQRPSVEYSDIGKDKPSKSQGIIGSIFLNKDISEIKICKITGGSIYSYESIDGGHRKRAILRFLNNKFPIHKSYEAKLPGLGGKYYSDLTNEQRKWFLNYTLRLVIYAELKNDKKGESFRDCNNSTPVNHQEMLNSYGDIPVANFIRNTVRVIPRLDNSTHNLFYYDFDKKGEPKYKWIGFANNRLDHDERVARITYLAYIGEKLNVCDKDQLEELYQDLSLTEEEVAVLAKKVNKCLDFLERIAVVRKKYKNGTGLNSKEFTTLYRLYFYFKEKYGDFKLVDAHAFYVEFETAMLKFVGRDENNLIKDIIYDGSEPRMMFEAFSGYLTVHTSKRKIVDSCKWLTENAGFDPVTDGSIQIRDVKRCFNRLEIEEKLSQQKYKCWVTGQELTMENAEGAHIVPHSKGGKTTFDNLVVVHKEHNRKMGEMHAEEYRDLFLSKKKKVA